MEQTIIYYLHNGNDIPFYVGKTINLKARLRGHKKIYGSHIQLEIIDKVDTTKWVFWEKYWISQFKTWGFELTNANNGGGGVAFCTPNHKQKISQAQKGKRYHLGKTHTQNTKLLMGVHKKGNQYKLDYITSQETKDKIRESKLGKTHSNESKIKMSQARKGKPLSKEHIDKIKAKRVHLKGRKNTWQILPVIQLDLEGNFIKEWESQTQAQIFFNKPKSDGVGACCRGEQKTAYGYKWKFKN